MGEDGFPAEIKEIWVFFSCSCMYCYYNVGDMKYHTECDAKIFTLYKIKITNNHRGISLSVAGKIFAKILLKHLQRLADCILPETMSRFRLG